MKYTVARFDIINDPENNVAIREYVILGKNLSIENAKKMKSENYGSWTYPQFWNK